jgi:hypothetical protein
MNRKEETISHLVKILEVFDKLSSCQQELVSCVADQLLATLKQGDPMPTLELKINSVEECIKRGIESADRGELYTTEEVFERLRIHNGQ